MANSFPLKHTPWFVACVRTCVVCLEERIGKSRKRSAIVCIRNLSVTPSSQNRPRIYRYLNDSSRESTPTRLMTLSCAGKLLGWLSCASKAIPKCQFQQGSVVPSRPLFMLPMISCFLYSSGSFQAVKWILLQFWPKQSEKPSWRLTQTNCRSSGSQVWLHLAVSGRRFDVLQAPWLFLPYLVSQGGHSLDCTWSIAVPQLNHHSYLWDKKVSRKKKVINSNKPSMLPVSVLRIVSWM